MTKFSWRGYRVLVLGLGVHGGGAAVAKWLVAHGARVTVSDIQDRAALKSSLKLLHGLPIKYVLGQHPTSLLKDCSLIMLNPGVPRSLPLLKLARQRGIRVENEASLFLRLSPARLTVGVTGSKGKSTTSALLGEMLKRQNWHAVVAGNIRETKMFQVLDKITPSTPVVLELSSWHLEVVGQHKLSPPLAIITNVVPDHLNRYRSMPEYTQAKAQIFLHQLTLGAVVLNYDNAITRRLASQAPGRVYWFSVKRRLGQGAYVRAGRAWWRDGGLAQELFRVTDLKVVGQHNLANALAAAAAARLAGVSPGKIRQAVSKFSGLPDRLELVRTWRGVRYYNDTTATAPVGAQAAIQTLLPAYLVLIAGGTDKLLPYRDLARDIKRYVKAVVLLPGSATVKLQRALSRFTPQLLARSMFEAVRLAYQLAPPGAVVLLSPGAASFGLFRHEFERGEQFRRAVHALH